MTTKLTDEQAQQFVKDYNKAIEDGWVLVKRGDGNYPPETLEYRGGIYTYKLVE